MDCFVHLYLWKFHVYFIETSFDKMKMVLRNLITHPVGMGGKVDVNFQNLSPVNRI